MLGYPLTDRARKSGTGWVDLCPAHDDRNHSLSIGIGRTGELLLHCFAGCSFPDILAAAGLRGQRPALSPAAARAHKAAVEARQRKNLERAIQTWHEGVPVAGSLSQQYLAQRGISTWGELQRHHPRLFHHASGGWRAALVSPVIRSGQLVGIHRIFLDEAGRKIDKMMLGTCGGGAAHLLRGGVCLVVAEGVETTLALRQMMGDEGHSYWSALSAGGIRALDLPATPGKLIVAADGDATGQQAAEELARRAARHGWDASVMFAPEGKDWNDVLLEEACHA